jgi:outer membrane autotransporter protein
MRCLDVAGFGPFAFVDFGETSSGTVSAVQSLISVLNTNNTAFLTQTSAFVGAPANPAPGQPGGGVWARGIGGSVTTRTSGSYAYGASALNPAGGGNCRTTTSQDFAGVQVGADISRLNIDGYNMHFGVTAGYSESSVSSPTGTGRLGSEFQIPFMGVYAAVTRGGFFADAQARWDFYHARLNDPSNGIFDQGLNARSLSLTGNVGYQIPLGDNWFIEPSAGLVYSRANVDRFSLFGTLFLDASPGLSGPARVRINDFDSVLGRASLRVGRNFVVNNIALQPFFTASVFNEFAGSRSDQHQYQLRRARRRPGRSGAWDHRHHRRHQLRPHRNLWPVRSRRGGPSSGYRMARLCARRCSRRRPG